MIDFKNADQFDLELLENEIRDLQEDNPDMFIIKYHLEYLTNYIKELKNVLKHLIVPELADIIIKYVL